MLQQKKIGPHPTGSTLTASSGTKLVCLTAHFSLSELPEELGWLGCYGRVYSSHTDKYKMVEWLERRRNSHFFEKLCLLVDLEALGGVSRGFEFLRNLRESFKSTPLILFTVRAKSHDFSSERSVICDATLRFPFSSIDLECAIDAAWENNRLFQFRIEEVNYE